MSNMISAKLLTSGTKVALAIDMNFKIIIENEGGGS